MGKTAAILLVLVFLMSLLIVQPDPVSAATPDSWTSKAPMQTARAYLGVSAVNGKVYAIGGTSASDIGSASTGATLTAGEVSTNEMYDPVLNSWTTMASMPTARVFFGTASYQNLVFCMGGYNDDNQYQAVVANEAYDIVTDSWAAKASLRTPRFAAATNMVKGKIYVLGGRSMPDFGSPLTINEVYDPQTDTWTTKSPSPLPVVSSASAVVDNKIYVLGEDTARLGYNVVEEYDPATDSWTVKETTVDHAWFLLTAAATSGINAPKRIYFFGENITYVYNPYADYLTSGTPAPTARLIASVAVVNDTFYLIGGRTGQWGVITLAYPSTLNEAYTPIGYGTPDPNYKPPTPSPSPSPSPSPTQSPEPQQLEPFPATSVVAVAVSVAVVGAGLLVYFRKRKS